MRAIGCWIVGMSTLLTGCGQPLAPTVEAAEAATVTFTLVGPQQTIKFSLPVSPTPDGFASQCALSAYTFCSLKVPVTVNGDTQSLTTTFYGNGGMSLAAGIVQPLVDLTGPHLFTGTIQEPTFVLGQYKLLTVHSRDPQQNYTLTISTSGSKPSE